MSAYQRRLRKKRSQRAKLTYLETLSKDVLFIIYKHLLSNADDLDVKTIDMNKFTNPSYGRCIGPDNTRTTFGDNSYNNSSPYMSIGGHITYMIYLPKIPMHKHHQDLLRLSRTCKRMFNTIKKYRTKVTPVLVSIEKLFTQSVCRIVRKQNKLAKKQTHMRESDKAFKKVLENMEVEPLSVVKLRRTEFNGIEPYRGVDYEESLRKWPESTRCKYPPDVVTKFSMFQYKLRILSEFYDLNNAKEIFRMSVTTKMGRHTLFRLLKSPKDAVWGSPYTEFHTFTKIFAEKAGISTHDLNNFFIYYTVHTDGLDGNSYVIFWKADMKSDIRDKYTDIPRTQRYIQKQESKLNDFLKLE